MTVVRQDQATVSLRVDDRDIPIIFSTRSGGMTDSEESKHRSGGGRKQRALGGAQTTENVTLEGDYEPDINGASVEWLRSRAGKGRAIVTELTLDNDDNVFGQAQPPWTGVVKSVTTGDYDADSGDPRLVVVEISTHTR